nr:Chain C, peptide from Programmed cell death 6-interacting protein [Homo sapiens]3WUV_F Chain F, peptide from Programmed cell death 6-interacting protein [Homo sapiens]3WUV_I Chain I, peptide from Programmed cell death 6-interacting protein [Homo sapiens]3WUV_L Chain L, peptide from Programmed cell death 6-interacting protein [Homo sapiens]3WUV_O Chain O, peptide from Programmed cell death 6-interacting protein [Homo sapiens]3WUV_R Chain R, peptide from Programmed cell death 6-interacting pr
DQAQGPPYPTYIPP